MTMSEEEDCDDLPSITVNTSANNSSTFAMPSAEQLAEQRARDLESERQLEALRQRAHALERVEQPLSGADEPAPAPERELAAAVTALSVRAPPERAAPAAELWAALAPHLPPPAAALLEPLRAPAPAPRALLSRCVAAAAGALAAPGAWADDELQSAAALLSVAVLARESRCARAAARALQALLDDHATADQVEALATLLLAALPAARARMRLADALRSGARAAADRAAAALTAAAVLRLLRAPPAPAPAPAPAPPAPGLEALARAGAAWRACGAPERCVCVQLAGRLLAAAGAAAPAHCERLLAHLALPPAAADDAHRPDRLKALVGVSKLKLLFGAKNAANSQTRPQPDITK